MKKQRIALFVVIIVLCSCSRTVPTKKILGCDGKIYDVIDNTNQKTGDTLINQGNGTFYYRFADSRKAEVFEKNFCPVLSQFRGDPKHPEIIAVTQCFKNGETVGFVILTEKPAYKSKIK